MHSTNWDALESLFDEVGVKPIVGVIPDNRDPSMMISPVDVKFWDRMRSWRDKGWEIVMHGLHHVYHPVACARQTLLRFGNQSEFVGLSLSKQREMLSEGLVIMSEEDIHPRAFMAPSHTFDTNTLKALTEVTDIRIITDGHAFFPFEKDGFTWIPQQLWRFYNMPFGIWCICLHPNTMTQSDILRLSFSLRRNAHRFIDFNEALEHINRCPILDRGFSALYQSGLKLKRFNQYLRRR